jgi:hypothetical protein
MHTYGWLLGGLLLVATVREAPGEEAPGRAQIRVVAEAGLPGFLARIPAGAEAEFGFSQTGDTARATLGEPLHLLTITPDALRAYRPGDDVDTVLSETDMWYVPVLVDDEVRAVLVIDRMAEGWQAVSLGYAALAADLNALQRAWPKAAGFDPQLVCVFQARRYLFTIPQRGTRNLTLLSRGAASESARRGAVETLADVATVLEGLKPEVEANLTGHAAPEGGRP